MRLSNALIVYRKELRDMLRDRRTIFGMLVFPVILFPLLTAGFGGFEQKMRKKAQAESATVMVLGVEHAPLLAERLRKAEGIRLVPPAGDYARQISDKKLRAALDIPAGFEQAVEQGSTPAPQLQVYYYNTEIRSETALRRLDEILREYRDSVVQSRLAARQLPPAILKPVETKRQNVATEEKVSGLKLGVLLPYFLILLCLSGAMHPAMDLTAGEKERGTLETILASAVSRTELVVGKFLLVLTASLVTAMMSLTSLFITLKLSKAAADNMTRGAALTISPQAAGAILLLVLPLAVFFAASLLTISLFAKSYKEAQSYLGPLMLAMLLPAIAAMLPGVELNPKLALVPILNISLTVQEVLTGNYPWGMMAIVFLSTCVWAGLALTAAVKMFQKEEVLFRA